MPPNQRQQVTKSAGLRPSNFALEPFTLVGQPFVRLKSRRMTQPTPARITELGAWHLGIQGTAQRESRAVCATESRLRTACRKFQLKSKGMNHEIIIKRGGGNRAACAIRPGPAVSERVGLVQRLATHVPGKRLPEERTVFGTRKEAETIARSMIDAYLKSIRGAKDRQQYRQATGPVRSKGLDL